jgi:hypothetical protein
MASDPLAVQLANQFRLAITIVPYPSHFDEMMEILIAADDQPDIFLLALNAPRMHQLASGGIIRGIPDEMLAEFPMIETVIAQNPLAQASRRIYGAVGYIPCVYDINPAYATCGVRIFYRKDWAEILQLTAFETTEDLFRAARTFAGEANPNRPNDEAGLIGIAVDKPERFVYMFGEDPYGWVLEGENFIPVYFSERMIQPLTFARRLYAEGFLVFSNGQITLNDAGIVMAEAGTPQAMSTVITPVMRSLRASADEVLARHVSIMNPPHATGHTASWGTRYRPEGWFAQVGLADGVLYRFLALLDFSLTQEGIDYARYGITEETYTRQNGRVYLFTDPMTFRAYDLANIFPTGQFLLGLLTRDTSREADLFYPSSIPVSVRRHTANAVLRYYSPIDSADALCRMVHAPARDALEIDFNAYFYNIITGEEPVNEMFARFKDECIRLGVEEAIVEVNRMVRRVN